MQNNVKGVIMTNHKLKKLISYVINIIIIMGIILLLALVFYLDITWLNYFIFFTIIIILICIIRSLFKFKKTAEEYKKGPIELIKNFAEIVVFFCAGLYFIYQFIGNSDITPLSTEVILERTRTKGNYDHLVIKAKLNNGSIASLRLSSITAYTTNLKSQDITSINFHGLKKKSIASKCSKYHLKCNENNRYHLAANESTEFSTHIIIDSNQVYRVEILIVGERRKFLHKVCSQFQASAVTVPIYKNK
ncbi:hypothetical protein [Aquimarina aquimarini]|uniref:hypothetical protein n=1 Tax=Aquimarina aquimarini TaxID=1191734 RepID=UPI000D56039D|nr:hypothetical protein [Aquimarina aquimarini]